MSIRSNTGPPSVALLKASDEMMELVIEPSLGLAKPLLCNAQPSTAGVAASLDRIGDWGEVRASTQTPESLRAPPRQRRGFYPLGMETSVASGLTMATSIQFVMALRKTVKIV